MLSIVDHMCVKDCGGNPDVFKIIQLNKHQAIQGEHWWIQNHQWISRDLLLHLKWKTDWFEFLETWPAVANAEHVRHCLENVSNALWDITEHVRPWNQNWLIWMSGSQTCRSRCIACETILSVFICFVCFYLLLSVLELLHDFSERLTCRSRCRACETLPWRAPKSIVPTSRHPETLSTFLMSCFNVSSTKDRCLKAEFTFGMRMKLQLQVHWNFTFGQNGIIQWIEKTIMQVTGHFMQMQTQSKIPRLWLLLNMY